MGNILHHVKRGGELSGRGNCPGGICLGKSVRIPFNQGIKSVDVKATENEKWWMLVVREISHSQQRVSTRL